MIMVLDCETLDMQYNFIYDLAWAKVERNKIVDVRNFLVKEHLSRMATGSFSKEKVGATMDELSNGNAEIKSWAEITAILADDMSAAKHIYAYNAPFDRGKVSATCGALQVSSEFFDSSAIFDKWRDLWAWASNTILYKKSYLDWCNAHGYLTDKGNFKTSAEVAIKFIMNDTDYVEKHTARADVLDEYEIYKAIKREVKREFSETCTAEEDGYKWKISPSYHIKRLNQAIAS